MADDALGDGALFDVEAAPREPERLEWTAARTARGARVHVFQPGRHRGYTLCSLAATAVDGGRGAVTCAVCLRAMVHREAP